MIEDFVNGWHWETQMTFEGNKAASSASIQIRIERFVEFDYGDHIHSH